jgi:outer membrane receptor for ferric coprogen and ferric-rhodotorulic acid
MSDPCQTQHTVSPRGNTTVLRLRRSALVTALLAASCTVGAAPAPASAAQAQAITIPAGPLGPALTRFSTATGVPVSFDQALVAGRSSPGLAGDYSSIAQGFERLTRGTGLVVEELPGGGYVVRQAAPAAAAAQTGTSQATTLDSVQVFGTLEDDLSVGSKTGLSLRETPKSVTVVTRERLDAQNLTTLNGAMTQTTGITNVAYGPVDNFYYSRGFRVTTFQLDGGAPATTGTVGAIINPDLAIIDHVEMLRGVDGMYSGAGDPGGVINLVRKRPTRDFQARVNLMAGSWDSYRSEVDVSSPLTADGRLRGRGVLAYENKHSFIDRYQPEKFVGYGVLEYDLTDRATLTVGTDLENSNHRGDPGWVGVMRYSDGTDLGLGRHTSFSTNWDTTKYDNREYFAKLEQQYGDTGLFKVNLTRMQQDYMYRGITVLGAVDPQTRSGSYYWTDAANGHVIQDLFDASANGRFTLFGREHRYTVGADYSKISNDGLTEYQPTAASTASWPAPDEHCTSCASRRWNRCSASSSG